MAKSDQKQARASAQTTSQQAQQQLAPVIQGNQQQQQVDLGRATEQYGAANQGLNSAGKTYQNFADTGGFDEAAKTNYLNRATSGVTNTGTALEQQAQQMRSKSGGAGTGGQVAQIARQLGQTQADATNQAQMNLNQQINANKLAGASGLTDVAKAHSMLFDENTGAASDLGKQVLAAYGIQYQTEAQANQILAQLATTPGIFDNIMRVAGVAGGIMEGAASMGAGGGGKS